MIRTPAVDSARLQADLAALSEFRDPGSPGWTRRVFSEPYLRSRNWIAGRMADAGLAVIRDAAGNLVGTLPGSLDAGLYMGRLPGPSHQALVTGSHTDTVSGGGRFDGPAGVLGAIEVARCIRDSGWQLRHDLVVVDFLGEEPNDFGLSCIGSRAIAGTLTEEHLAARDPSGQTLAEAIQLTAGPGRIAEGAWRPGSVAAFVELHIEQGPVLEQAGVPLGVVSGIAGIERVLATFTGRADHAGTTPMDARHDALCAAAEAVLALERLASDGGGVGTTGRIEVSPGALNVVPELVNLWAELRSTDGAWLDERTRIYEDVVTRAGARRGVSTEVRRLSRTAPVVAAESVTQAMAGAIAELGLRFVSLPSGAGHDSVQMARLGPVGMLFVPSAGGRSHCPEEWTAPEHLEAGVSALLGTLLAMDAR